MEKAESREERAREKKKDGLTCATKPYRASQYGAVLRFVSFSNPFHTFTRTRARSSLLFHCFPSLWFASVARPRICFIRLFLCIVVTFTCIPPRRSRSDQQHPQVNQGRIHDCHRPTRMIVELDSTKDSTTETPSFEKKRTHC